MNSSTGKGKKYLFIGGVGRSGTSSLIEIIGSHPLIVLGLERYNKLFRKQDYLITKSHFEKERFLNIQEGDTFYIDFNRFRIHKDIDVKWDNAVYVGVKYPRITLVYEETEQALGDFRIIYIYRNIFDVAESWNRRLVERARWPRQRDYKKAVSFWNNSLQVTKNLIDNRENIICLRYEDIYFTQKTIAPVFDWLRLGLNENIINALNEMRKIAPIKKAQKGKLTDEQNEYIRQNAWFDLYEEFNAKYNILNKS